MNRVFIYDILYALAARDGRESALFGACAPVARDNFAHSLAGDGFPELWFELPLKGDAWFDLHALASREHLAHNTEFLPETCGNCPSAFAWFAAQTEGARQLALSWDTSSGDTQDPAVQFLTCTHDPNISAAFLEAANRPDAVPSYRSFIARIPKDWYPCYTGVFPRRQTPHLRVECIPSEALQRAYANNPTLLEQHLRATGFSAFDDTLLPRCQLLAQSPFRIEFQFDVLPDGTASPTLGVSIRFPEPPGTPDEPAFETDGVAGTIMRKVESWGLADDRWRLLADTGFSKRISHGKSSGLLFCFPAFLKLRWRDGTPLDAKAYLMAGLQ